MNYIDKIILLSFPFMDVGFVFFGIPFRLGEVAFFLSFLRILNSKSALKITRLNKLGSLLLLLIFINLLFTFIASTFNVIDRGFYVKYILRNFIYLFTLTSFILKPIDISQIKIEFFIKYILIVVLIFYLIEFIDFYVVNFNWGETLFVSRQGKSIFNNFLIRFAGPSSEPAYIIPLLSIPLLYGFFTRKFNYSIISLILMLITFSSFGYLVIIFSIFYFLKNIDDKKIKNKVENFLVNIFVFISLISFFFIEKIGILITYNWDKLKTYFGIGNAYEWSASQRAAHIKLALDLFLESSFFKKIFGSGTGYYSKVSKSFTKYYLDDAEEAHNLYVSTLLDRGIIGLVLLLILFYFITKINISNKFPKEYRYFFISIKFGILVRMLHWFFTGMLWQYYFWVEVVLLISASTYSIKRLNENR